MQNTQQDNQVPISGNGGSLWTRSHLKIRLYVSIVTNDDPTFDINIERLFIAE